MRETRRFLKLQSSLSSYNQHTLSTLLLYCIVFSVWGGGVYGDVAGGFGIGQVQTVPFPSRRVACKEEEEAAEVGIIIIIIIMIIIIIIMVPRWA
jgi:hypothetical protein